MSPWAKDFSSLAGARNQLPTQWQGKQSALHPRKFPLVSPKDMTNKWQQNKKYLFTYSLGAPTKYRYSVSKICVLIYSYAWQI